MAIRGVIDVRDDEHVVTAPRAGIESARGR